MEKGKKGETSKHEIIYVLRTSQQHHVQLSFMADQKANIIIGSFLVYCTILFTYILKNNYWHIALYFLTFFYLLAFLAALTALLPSLNRVKSNTPNLLFFHGFSRLSEEGYVRQMMEILEKDMAPREMLLKDIYLLGIVLDKKYFKLRVSYSSLLLGVFSSLLVFFISSI